MRLRRIKCTVTEILDRAFAFDHKDTGLSIRMCDMFIFFMRDEYVGTL